MRRVLHLLLVGCLLAFGPGSWAEEINESQYPITGDEAWAILDALEKKAQMVDSMTFEYVLVTRSKADPTDYAPEVLKGGKTMWWTITTTGTQWRQGLLSRMEGTMTFSGFAGPDGQIVVQSPEPTHISVNHPDASYDYKHELGMREKGEPLQSGFDPIVQEKTERDSTIEILGTEFVDDKLCIVAVESSESIRIKSWIWQKIGIGLRAEYTKSGEEEPGLVLTRYNFRFEEIPAHLFEVPAELVIEDANGVSELRE